MAEGYRLVLTEEGYTTTDGPTTKDEAMAEFTVFPDCGAWMGRLAPGYDRHFVVARETTT